MLTTARLEPEIIEATIERLSFACPEVLKKKPMWLVWKASPNEQGKILKLPFYANGKPRTGENGSHQDMASLTTFDKALKAFEGGGYHGLGMAHLQEFQVLVVDFDDKNGAGLHPEAMAMCEGTYAEKSPGGKGLHAIFVNPWLSTAPHGKNNPIGIECFSKSGYTTFSGQRINTNDPAELRVSTLQKLVEFLHPSPQQETALPKVVETVTPQTILELRSALNTLPADDYSQWIENGQRLKCLGDVGRGLWLDWSQQSERFDTSEAISKWQSFDGQKTGYQAVFAAAQRLGWVNPASKVATDFNALEKAEKPVTEFFVSVGELLKDKTPPQWLIQAYIEVSTTAMLFGASTAGKSFLAISWALAIATGREWEGGKVRQGGVVYLAGEGHSGFKRRCAAWATHHGVDIDSAPLYFNQCQVQLIDEASCVQAHQAIARLIQTHGDMALIVVDTFNRVGGGDENSNTDTSKILANIERYFTKPFGCAVLIVHHTGTMETQRSRGASALPAGMDSFFRLDGVTGTRTLHCGKQKDAEPPPDRFFSLVTIPLPDWPADPDSGEVITSAVLVRADEETTASTKNNESPDKFRYG